MRLRKVIITCSRDVHRPPPFTRATGTLKNVPRACEWWELDFGRHGSAFRPDIRAAVYVDKYLLVLPIGTLAQETCWQLALHLRTGGKGGPGEGARRGADNRKGHPPYRRPLGKRRLASTKPWGGVFGFAFLATPGVHHCIAMARVVLLVLMDKAKESFRFACLEALPFIHAPNWSWRGAHLFYVGVVSLDVREACSRLISPGLPLLFGEQRRVGLVGVFLARPQLSMLIPLHAVVGCWQYRMDYFLCVFIAGSFSTVFLQLPRPFFCCLIISSPY